MVGPSSSPTSDRRIQLSHLRGRLGALGHDEAVVDEIAVVALVVVDGPGVLGPQLRLIEPQVGRTKEALRQVEQVRVEGQSVQVPRSPRSADDAGPLVGCQPGMSGRVGEVLLGPRVVQPQSFLRRCQFVSLEESLEHQIALLPQICHTTVGHPHHAARW